MKIVYVLQHVYETHTTAEEVKVIGVYSTKEKAKKAITRLRKQTGFKEHKKGFCVDEYEVDKDHWTEGFISMKK